MYKDLAKDLDRCALVGFDTVLLHRYFSCNDYLDRTLDAGHSHRFHGRSE